VKRIFLAVVGTVLGLVALLSFKSQNHVAVGAKLPSASLGTGSSSSAGPTTAAPAPTTAAPTTAAPTTPATTSPATTSKTYDGSAVQTRYGTVQVAVTVAGGKITNVAFLQLTGNDGRSNDINNQAAPILLQETLSAQNANIDTVSGATFTSEGYLQSLQSALDQAGVK
jgi:uncharacterized protein with FMN-binding domain